MTGNEAEIVTGLIGGLIPTIPALGAWFTARKAHKQSLINYQAAQTNHESLHQIKKDLNIVPSDSEAGKVA